MRHLPSGLAAHLAAGATTLCHCWRLIRTDGQALGFTDHDRDLAFDGTVFSARTGLEAAEASAELGFAVGGGEVAGALVSAGITEGDVAAGRYDDASVETWLVNWAGAEERVLLDIGSLGEIRRADGAFVAELRGLMHRLDEERGRLFRATCGADLGDARCRVDLDAHTATGTVTRTDGEVGIAASGVGFADGWCTGGRLVFAGGANAGLAFEVKMHRRVGGVAEFDLWQRAPHPIAVGDIFRVGAGCDKRLATCRGKFDNVVNFQGFPHMPGNDFVMRVPQQGEPGFDGGSFFPVTRADSVVTAARSWIGTPYRHQAALKGVGCDCLGLLRGVWREVMGAEPERPPPYAPDWAEAGADTLAAAARRHLIPVERDVRPGDVLLFRWRDGLPAKHCAIATGRDTMIHAHDGACVAEVTFRPWWQRHLAGVFAFPET